MPLTVVARIHARPGREDLVRTERDRLVAPMRAGRGCLRYDPRRDRAAPGRFMVHETRTSRDRWQARTSAPHLAASMRATEGAVGRVVPPEVLHETDRVA